MCLCAFTMSTAETHYSCTFYDFLKWHTIKSPVYQLHMTGSRTSALSQYFSRVKSKLDLSPVYMSQTNPGSTRVKTNRDCVYTTFF